MPMERQRKMTREEFEAWFEETLSRSLEENWEMLEALS